MHQRRSSYRFRLCLPAALHWGDLRAVLQRSVSFLRQFDGIFPLPRIFLGGGGGQRFIPQPALFIFQVKINSHTPVPHFRPESVHSGLASWDDRGRVVPGELRVSRFPWSIPKLCLDSIVIPFRLCWVKGVGVFRCNLPPVPMVEWSGSFVCHYANTGWNGHRIRVSTES